MKQTPFKAIIGIALLLGIAVGFWARPSIDRLRNPNLSDIHTPKVSVHQAITRHADIVMLGDSLTHWAEWSVLFPGVSIANRGIAGDKLTRIFDRLPSVYQLHPRKIFLTAGTNDLYKAGAEPETFRQYLAVIEDIRKHGITPIVQSTFLASEQYKDADAFNTRVNALNAELRAYCDANKIAFIDLNAVISPGARTTDGIHLLGSAYTLWAAAIASLMN